jgi:hypothetical protein
MKRDFFRSFLAKDRREQGRTNPLFPVAKKSWIKRALPPLVISVVIIIAFYGAYRFIVNKQFYIEQTKIEGIYSLSQDSVNGEINSHLDSRAGLFFSHRHSWFIDKARLKSQLENAFPLEVQSMDIVNQTLTVTVAEDIVMVALHTGEKWYLVSLDGTIVREITPEEIPLLTAPKEEIQAPSIPFNRLPKVELGVTSSSLENGAPVFQKELLAGLITLNTKLSAGGLTPKVFTFKSTEDSWVSVATDEKKYAIYMDLLKPLEDQVFMLRTVMDKYAEKEDSISYIDVRFGNHVYVK